MWSSEPSRHALLRLWSGGTLRRRTAWNEAWAELARLPWTRRTSRRDELALLSERRGELEELLDNCWPGWRAIVEALAAEGLPCDAVGLGRLRDAGRRRGLPGKLPGRLNRRTAASALAEHSKALLSQEQRKTLTELELTSDGLIRLRPSPGLLLRRDEVEHDALRLAELLGEVGLTERALRDGTRLCGKRPLALLLVENVGAYMDLQPPAGWLVAHVPGWNTRTIRLLFAQLARVPVVLFGDLDPNGVRIARHLAEHLPGMVRAVPDFWREYVDSHALRKDWPEELSLDGEPPLIRELAARGLWLEQEAIVLDGRLSRELALLV